jgi:hypothetical protein
VKALVARVQEQIGKQLKTLERAKIARKSLSSRGAIIVAKDIAECVALANQYAPEHLVIASNDADRIAKDVTERRARSSSGTTRRSRSATISRARTTCCRRAAPRASSRRSASTTS